jgi:AraC family transcriptional regulator of adaptative response/methylated-DNA-[protein]-cysteine methyltransferase
MIAAACRLIEMSAEPPSLDALAARAGMSRSNFHRVFKAHVGVTPKAYAAARRTALLRCELGRDGVTVTRAMHSAGFNSAGRLYAQSSQILGMTPTAFRSGGAGATIRFAVGECSLGAVLVAATERGVCAILLGDDPEPLVHELEARFPRADLRGGDRQFERLVSQVVGLVEDPARGHALPLDIRGTAFQQRVWQALGKIPPGATITYAELAQRVGRPQSVRAVASACAANGLAVAIPCHRAVRTGGGLAGYRWGVERKRALLMREGEQRASTPPNSRTVKRS